MIPSQIFKSNHRVVKFQRDRWILWFILSTNSSIFSNVCIQHRKSIAEDWNNFDGHLKKIVESLGASIFEKNIHRLHKFFYCGDKVVSHFQFFRFFYLTTHICWYGSIQIIELFSRCCCCYLSCSSRFLLDTSMVSVTIKQSYSFFLMSQHIKKKFDAICFMSVWS